MHPRLRPGHLQLPADDLRCTGPVAPHASLSFAAVA
ncbi:hypothetical protein RSAG8_12316, partial [Rhizoctonia solani AG-8 WAC10335]